MRRPAIFVLGAVALLLSVTAQAAGPASQRYVGGFAGVASVCGANTACFQLDQNAPSSGIVLINDALGLAVGGHAVFKSGDDEIGLKAFCGGTEVNVPKGATSLEVRIQEVSGCGPGSTGNVTFG